MWYFILPPIIVVLCLWFVLWYLSRKGTDPQVTARAEILGKELMGKVAFARTKTFFLHVLEKTAYRFKVMTLRMHNTFHNVTQALKERQKKFQDKSEKVVGVSVQKSSLVAPSLKQEAARRFFKKKRTTAGEERLGFLEKNAQLSEHTDISENSVSGTVTLDTPIVRNRKEMTRPSQEGVGGAPETDIPSRPMVSEYVARPEKARVSLQADRAREEAFITRIAVNPKDFAAYEGLGDYYFDRGNIKDAKECYRQVLKLSPVQRMVKIKIRRLEKIFSKTE